MNTTNQTPSSSHPTPQDGGKQEQQFPRLIVRPIAGSSELGFTVRHEWTKLEPTGSKMSIIADPNGEYWYTVAHIDGAFNFGEKIAWANRIADACSSVNSIAGMRARVAELEGALRAVMHGTGCHVFLDGRNEHGTHILPGNVGDVDWIEVERIENENDPEFTENVFKEAEEHGFKAGDWVWLDWRRDPGQYGDEGQCEIAPYLEYNGVNKEISLTLRALTPPQENKA